MSSTAPFPDTFAFPPDGLSPDSKGNFGRTGFAYSLFPTPDPRLPAPGERSERNA